MRTIKCLSLSLILVFVSNVTQAQSIPIPRKRPNILSVSPAYIQELRQRDKNIKARSLEESLESIMPSAHSEFIDDGEDYNSIEDIDADRLLSALESKSGYNNISTYSMPPIPQRKPSDSIYPVEIEIEDMQEEEQYASGSASLDDPKEEPDASNETALVSFALSPNQVTLDENIKQFLLKHAVKMFKKDPNLIMEIHAYASSEENKEYSDVRRSLARALEVRSFLLEQDIDPSRLKLTPFGQDKEKLTDDRIDLLFIASQ